MASKQMPIFHSLKAWFSSSVSREVKNTWNREGGREVPFVKDANFIFTSDARCPDTLRIFEGDEFLCGFLCVFHTSFIAACLDMNSAHEVPAAKYIVLPPDMPADIQHIAFVNDRNKNAIPKAFESRGQDQAGTSKESDSSHRESSMNRREQTDSSHTRHHSGGFVGGLEVTASDVNFNISDLDAIPFVSSLPRVKGEICDFTPGANGFSVSLKV